MIDVDGCKRTPLYDRHTHLGARMTAFGGYLMPVQYTGILAEHRAARTAAAVFDTCHMGEFLVSGKTALADLERLVSCHLAALETGRCRYGLMCNPEGGVIDDLLLYRLTDTEFMLVVNAGTQDGDFDWISSNTSAGTSVRNISESTAKVDIQGPGAPRIVQSLTDTPIEKISYYEFQRNAYKGQPVLISRTGYTGEVGFEFYTDPVLAGKFWDECIEKGAVAAGLGARDTLRLEMGMPLYSHELRNDRSAAESGLTQFISKKKEFVGSAAIRENAVQKKRLIGMAFDGRQSAREGNRIRSEEGAVIGTVTSGSFAPSLGYAVALGYVDSGFSASGTPVAVEARRLLKGRVVETPFFRGGTARRALAEFL